jgi:hypothetical protein
MHLCFYYIERGGEVIDEKGEEERGKNGSLGHPGVQTTRGRLSSIDLDNH